MDEFILNATRMLFVVADGLEIEKLQAVEEGKDISALIDRIDETIKMSDPFEREKSALALLDEICAIPVSKDFKYDEPSELQDIYNVSPIKNTKLKKNYNKAELKDKILGAWEGRAGGCLLGKPVERWTSGKIKSFAKDTDNLPIKGYFSSDISKELREQYEIVDSVAPMTIYGDSEVAWINNVDGMPSDDDTNYTVMALEIIEKYGKNFPTQVAGLFWIDNIPAAHCMTAERAAYRNILAGYIPPISGRVRNPYREWIGAIIRADLFGYISPGDPWGAAAMAWADAAIAQDKNGIYGEMFVAAMLSWAAVCDDIVEVIEVGLSCIPENCRLTEAIKDVVDWYKNGLSQSQAEQKIHERWNELEMHHWCHAISNAQVIVYSILYGEKDYTKTIGLSVEIGFDTDCNGATVGSIAGMMTGSKMLPAEFIAPLNNTIYTSLLKARTNKITDLADRTMALID